jgi:serine/threonine protein phosphatase PrpC
MVSTSSWAKLPSAAPGLRVSGTMLRHPGRVRAVNEDVVAYVIPGENDPGAARGALALVADGMGGHAAGDVASRIAAEMVVRLYYELDGSPADVLARCLAAANEAIYERSLSDPDCTGMGTTCTLLAFRDSVAFLAHIGDSRAYLWRDRTLQQISEDHSLVAELVRRGELTREEAAHSPQRHVIVRALGTTPTSTPSTWREGMPLLAGDVFVLCSDGLTDLVADATISETVARLSPFDACRALVDAALAAGGTDNISVGVFAIGTDAPPPEPRTTRPMPVPGGAS